MILSAVNVCYDLLHQPFAADGVTAIQNLNSERPALKIIRAVLRDSDIDPDDAVNYSMHRCYCKFKIKIEDDDEDETFNPESTLDELEIKDGDSVFIRKIENRVVENEDEVEEEGSTLRRSSRKRKETDYNENDYYDDPSKSTDNFPNTSRKRRSTFNPSNAPATVDEVSSNLENLTSNAASAARSISKLLGGDGWKTQSIGKLGPIQTRGHSQLQSLLRLVKTSLEIPRLSNSGRSGLFNSDLVEALTRAYHQRVGFSIPNRGQRNFFGLRHSDYDQANELLKGQIEEDGSWERSSLAHLDESALLNPVSRFHLSDSGLSGQFLTTARAICVFWNNDKWLTQAPLPGLSPVSLKNKNTSAILRQIAELTRVKPGEATPDGLPSMVLAVLIEVISNRKLESGSAKDSSFHGWNQSKSLPSVLGILKRTVGGSELTTALSASSPSTELIDRIDKSRNVRRKLRSGS